MSAIPFDVAAAEMLRRRKARRSLLGFCEAMAPEFVPAAHHRLLIDRLEQVAAGRIRRLMVFMPPGSAKSHYANVMFSAYFLGLNPHKNIITASYGQELADKWGRRTRNLLARPEFQAVFGFGVDATNASASRWATERGGEYLAVGVGGPVTGNRADGCVIDDPVKGREEADSQTIRDKTREWYKSDLYTRLKPGAWVVLIMTRWHEDDLAGWLLDEARRGGEQWEVVSLPAVAEENDPLGRAPGDPLWPEWFTPEMFAFARRDPRTWTALYQQRPAPDEGNFFRREWLRWYDQPPALSTLRTYGASDYAITDGGGDWTVHGVFGVDPDDNIYVLDWWRQKTTSDVWVDAFLDLMTTWKTLGWAEERGQIQGSVGPFITKRQLERRAYGYRKQFSSAHDKPTRARAIQARMAMGKVCFPRSAPWTADLVAELLTFPAGKHDDQVDVLSLVGRMLAEMVPGRPEAAPPHPNRDGLHLERLWKDHERRRGGAARI